LQKNRGLGQVAVAEIGRFAQKAEGLDMIIYAGRILHGTKYEARKALEIWQARFLAPPACYWQ